MQVLWEELDDAYPPAPKLALYAPIPQQDKLFHLIRLRVGEGCDLRLLPGVNCNTVPQRAANRTETGVMASGTPLTCQKQGGSGVSGVDHDRLAGVLKALFDRASRA
jgi:hypothetical protein